jgi:anaerobic selenocysteine-containing dehydrogenase
MARDLLRRTLPVLAPGVGAFRKDRAQPTQPVGERLVATHCCYCGVQCGMYLRVSDDGRVFGVEPRDHDINQLKLCPKGVTAYQQVNHADRLTAPLMRDRRDQPLREVSWAATWPRATTGPLRGGSPAWSGGWLPARPTMPPGGRRHQGPEGDGG